MCSKNLSQDCQNFIDIRKLVSMPQHCQNKYVVTQLWQVCGIHVHVLHLHGK